MKISAQGHLLVYNEWEGNPHIAGLASAGPKISLYTGTVNELPPKYSSNIKKNKLKVKTKQDIQRPEILDLGKAQIMWCG